MQAMQLIDADALIADLKAMRSEFDAIALDGMIRGIERQPTIDAVEVVHCKDCIMAKKPKNKKNRRFRDDELRCILSGCIVLANDFCSYGEKVEEVQNNDAGQPV